MKYFLESNLVNIIQYSEGSLDPGLHLQRDWLHPVRHHLPDPPPAPHHLHPPRRGPRRPQLQHLPGLGQDCHQSRRPHVQDHGHHRHRLHWSHNTSG